MQYNPLLSLHAGYWQLTRWVVKDICEFLRQRATMAMHACGGRDFTRPLFSRVKRRSKKKRVRQRRVCVTDWTFDLPPHDLRKQFPVLCQLPWDGVLHHVSRSTPSSTETSLQMIGPGWPVIDRFGGAVWRWHVRPLPAPSRLGGYVWLSDIRMIIMTPTSPTDRRCTVSPLNCIVVTAHPM